MKAHSPLARLADSFTNRALMCEKAGHFDLSTAHLEIAMKIMIEAMKEVPRPVEKK